VLPPRPAPRSPDALAFGALWASLLDVALLALLVAWAVDRWAPPQDLPWKPLRLADPPGLATGVKFARAAADPAACRAVLREGGMRFSEEPSRRRGYCSTENAVRLREPLLSPAAPTMTCPAALAYVFWVRHAVQPAAAQIAGGRVSRIEHYGTYACRNVYGRADGRPSEHAGANALDVAAFRLADGRRISVAQSFRDPGAEGAFLRATRDGACDWFRATLSPDYNAAHHDHLHLDYGRYGVCQ
jgi:hypothetical protein